MTEPVTIRLEFVRTENAADPYGFQFGSEAYLCRDAGRQDYDELALDWCDELLGLLDQARVPGSSQQEAFAALGKRLSEFLAPAGFRAHEQEILSAVKSGRPVDIVVSSSAAELYALPWELVPLRSTGQVLGELPNTLVRHVWPGVERRPVEQAEGRLLVGWSAAGGPVPSRAHVAGIERRTGTLLAFNADSDVIADVSLQTLDRRLAASEGSIRALHLLCHGVDGGLVFDSEDGLERIVADSRRLQTLLAPYAHQLDLVVLCACHGGDGGNTIGNRLGSVAQALHRAGIGAVVASRFPLSTAGSVIIAEELYGELADSHGNVRAALVKTRRALALASDHLDHVSLQLYAHPETPPLSLARETPPSRAEASPEAPVPERSAGERGVHPGLAAALLAVALVGVAVWMGTGNHAPVPPTPTPVPMAAAATPSPTPMAAAAAPSPTPTAAAATPSPFIISARWAVGGVEDNRGCDATDHLRKRCAGEGCYVRPDNKWLCDDPAHRVKKTLIVKANCLKGTQSLTATENKLTKLECPDQARTRRGDFAFSKQPVEPMQCTKIEESDEGWTAGDHYFCYDEGFPSLPSWADRPEGPVRMEWYDKGLPADLGGLDCIDIDEGGDFADAWNENKLCVSHDFPVEFRWSYDEVEPGKDREQCVQWQVDTNAWRFDNWLCWKVKGIDE